MEERKLKRKIPRTSTNAAAPAVGSAQKPSASSGRRHVGYSHNTGAQSSQKSKSRRGVRDKSRSHQAMGPKSTQNPVQPATTIQHSFLTDVSDVQEMEKGLLSLLNDFHSGKLQAFGNACSIDQMEHVREMQEKLARLHFDLYGEVDEMPEDQRKMACDTNMDKLLLNLMDKSVTAVPHSVKRWQLSGTDYDPETVRSLRSRFSAWTPLSDKRCNLQLFEDRVKLVIRWFDLWTDGQRKHLMSSLLGRCTSSQLRCCRDLLMETVPVTRLDFTTVLPRFLSLYVLSFLNPRDLCAAAQVSWQWRFLAEQDCLWTKRCVRRGWFLPYSPGTREYGAWKNHYIDCVSTLHWLPPRKAATHYRSLHQRAGAMEVEEERRQGRKLRQMIRATIQEEKRESLRTRRAWGSNMNVMAARGGSSQKGRSCSELPVSSWSSASGLKAVDSSSISQNHERLATPNPSRSHNACGTLSSFTYRPPTSPHIPVVHLPPPVLLLLISNRIPAYELILCGVKAGVTVVLYDHRGTLSALLTQIESAVPGQRAQRLGLLAPGDTEEVGLLHNSRLSEKTLLTQEQKEFWEKLSGWVVPVGEGGGIDIFSPLAATGSGVALIQALSTLTGLQVQAPMGLATGSFQNILSEWSDGSICAGPSTRCPAAPALQFVIERVLQSWCLQAQWIEEALEELRGHLEPQLQRVSLQMRGRALGHYLWERLRLEELCLSRDLSNALTDGLAALTKEESRPVEFLANFLQQWGEDKEEHEKGSLPGQGGVSPVPRPAQVCLEWRGVAARELHYSENVYLQRLNAVLKCRETKPLFRAFLKRADRTLSTHMLSLQELLLCPSWRIQEYVTLLQALSVHTNPDHPDRLHLTSALTTMMTYRDFIQKLKKNSERDTLMEETQKMIQSCPSLRGGNRQLILSQDAVLLRSRGEQLPDSLRTYEQVCDVGLFLFNDVLVLTRRTVHHRPFTLAHRSTHTFLSSAPVRSLAVREITHTRYVSHAFVLDGPGRSWVCATERGQEKDYFLSALRSTIRSALG
ncbi:hypothetical protein fugu_002298 [Takifugu bimaculatus]|uniref:DH domain-containing protein n=1 Tax=Takifugu bimaculatus TaxID=433685 RepID=A0A4Z2BQB4_9TELE|nr:hypothetical protein fugu_002298 [Takifugu bimaculatus]